MRIITIIGARPQFIKAAVVSLAISRHNATAQVQIKENILHTGQHYDYNMSQVFFDEMGIPTPTWHLACNNISAQAMAEKIVPIIQENADYIMVYGDTNSTLAGALAAEQCRIPLIHIEAGLRSFNTEMAEEYNRIETDKRSTLLFCPTQTAVKNLHREGREQGVYMVGDVMCDATMMFTQQANQYSNILHTLGIANTPYILATIHRAETTNDKEKLARIFSAFAHIAYPIILPLHPRTKKVVESSALLKELSTTRNLHIIESVSYIDMQMLEDHARCILTDSGGVQKEAYFHRVPCITMREETEWVETIRTGWNRLVGTDTEAIITATNHITMPKEEIAEYGNGHAAEQIIDIICQNAC